MSAWTKYVTEHYNAQKKINGGYMFKDALKDAAKTYKNRGKQTKSVGGKKNKKRRTAKNKTQKRRK